MDQMCGLAWLQTFKALVFRLGTIIFVLSMSLAHAATSTNYNLPNSDLPAGGGASTSSAYHLFQNIAHPADSTPSSSTGYLLRSGFIGSIANTQKANQTITFGSAPTVVVGGNGPLSATASSGLAVSFDSNTPTVCTVTGSTVAGASAGTCIVTGDQAGDGQYNPAAQVTQTFSIGLPSYSISTVANPLAGGSVNCNPNPVVVGGNSTCTATPNAGYVFSAFSGACTGSTCNLTNIQTNKTVTATFNAIPLVSLSPPTLTFSDQHLGTTSAGKNVSLTNNGAGTLNIATIASSVNVFAVTHNCPASLSAGGTCTLNVTFTPAAVGTRLGTISVTSDASGSPHLVTVSGLGVASNAPICSLTANPSTIRKNGTAILTASCSPAATSFSWTGGNCGSITTSTCTDQPGVTTNYSVTGSNVNGSSTASAQITVLNIDITPILMLLLGD